MKTIVTIILCFVFALNIDAQDALKLYGIKSGIIEYKLTGTRTGTNTMYFDNYGHKSATYSNITTNGKAQKAWAVSFDEMVYMYDPATKTGQKMKNPMIEGLKKVKDMDKFVQETYAKMGFKPAGNEKYLGKDCKVYKGDMGKVLVWNGLLMFMEMKYGGITTKQEATKIDVNVPVKASLFELPKDIKFTDMSAFGKTGSK